MLEHKRELDELIAIYSLEEDLFDLYVEGPTDRSIIENYLEYKRKDKSVIEIDDIDLSPLEKEYQDLNLYSNKDKLIALSRLLSEKKILTKVKCVVDRDFDGILKTIEQNKFLLYTDFSCIESYFFCNEHINKLLKLGIRNYPIETVFVIEQIGKVICGIFKLRMINKHFGFNGTKPKIKNHTHINKKTGFCDFNFTDYLRIFLNANKLIDRRHEIEKFIKEIEGTIGNDVRNQLNGHDFIEVLFDYINKTKNTVNFRLENFERTFYLSVQPNYLDKYELFEKLAE
jgi:hypothetical protein